MQTWNNEELLLGLGRMVLSAKNDFKSMQMAIVYKKLSLLSTLPKWNKMNSIRIEKRVWQITLKNMLTPSAVTLTLLLLFASRRRHGGMSSTVFKKRPPVLVCTLTRMHPELWVGCNSPYSPAAVWSSPCVNPSLWLCPLKSKQERTQVAFSP